MSNPLTSTGFEIKPPGEFSADDVNVHDIARALSMTCRFGGHVRRFYSVAEHSVRVAQWVLGDGAPRGAVRCALFHDAHEAYCGDMMAPQKPLVEGWQKFEQAYETVVRRTLGLPAQLSSLWTVVDHYDKLIVHPEAAQFHAMPQPPWVDRSVRLPADVCLEGLDPYDAEKLFLEWAQRAD